MALLVFISLRDSEAWKGKTGLWMPVLSRFYRCYLNPVIRVMENTCEYVCTHGHPFLYTDVWSTCVHTLLMPPPPSYPTHCLWNAGPVSHYPRSWSWSKRSGKHKGAKGSCSLCLKLVSPNGTVTCKKIWHCPTPFLSPYPQGHVLRQT